MVEPEWDDRYRDIVEGLALHDRETCPGCGLHPSVLNTPGLHLSLEDTYCEMCKVRDRHHRRVEDREVKYEQRHKDLKPGAPRPNDGLHVRIKSLTPGELHDRKQQRRRTDG